MRLVTLIFLPTEAKEALETRLDAALSIVLLASDDDGTDNGGNNISFSSSPLFYAIASEILLINFSFSLPDAVSLILTCWGAGGGMGFSF